MASEMLGPILLSAHNITYYQRLLADTREAIQQGDYPRFVQEKTHRWREGTNSSSVSNGAD
jgi:queuine tRNA-ribosyltransferase